jgi:hypothetical protein
MPLQFRGLAVFEPDTGNVRFAGYSTTKGMEHEIVICRASKDAMHVLCSKRSPGPNDILRSFEEYAGLIYNIASLEFDKGHRRPTITARSIMTFKL